MKRVVAGNLTNPSISFLFWNSKFDSINLPATEPLLINRNTKKCPLLECIYKMKWSKPLDSIAFPAPFSAHHKLIFTDGTVRVANRELRCVGSQTKAGVEARARDIKMRSKGCSTRERRDTRVANLSVASSGKRTRCWHNITRENS